MTRTTPTDGIIQTVLGPVAAADLGPTLMHEHILCDVTPPKAFPPGTPQVAITLENVWEMHYHWCAHYGNSILDDEAVALAELQRLREAGGTAVVEVSSLGLHPDPAALARISRTTGVHIVRGTGYYTAETLPPQVLDWSVERLAERLAADIREGDAAAGGRAGIIGEMGCSHPLADIERRALQAAARVQRATGAAISVHPGRDPAAPLEMVRWLERQGADPGRVIIGHLDRTLFQCSQLRELADTGCGLEFDFFGIETSYYPFQNIDLPTDNRRLDLIADLMDAGHRDQVLLSQDICTKTRLVHYGGHGYGHLLRNVVPLMRRRGFDTNDIDHLLAVNPRRWLSLPERDASHAG